MQSGRGTNRCTARRKLKATAVPDTLPKVLSLNLGFLCYRTDDKTQGAAVMFALLLFLALCVITIVGALAHDQGWFERVLQWLTSAFVLTAGVAIGKTRS